jgi:histone acetyltransferase MYST1
VVLPPFERRGYGTILISLAYEIAKRADVIGGPEKPLSEPGKQTFANYWRNQILMLLMAYGKRLDTIDIISRMTSIRPDEVAQMLAQLGVLTDATPTRLRYDDKMLRARFSELRDEGMKPGIDPEYFIWLPNDEFSEYMVEDHELEMVTGDSGLEIGTGTGSDGGSPAEEEEEEEETG